MTGLTAPKGTFDVLPPESARFLAVRDTLTAPLRRAGYGYVETPVFEHTEVFSRGVGESTDVVTKEMYTFDDRGGRSLTLRPELTVRHAPGHTQGSVVFSLDLGEAPGLVAGDVLFAGSVGRVDLPGGSWESMLTSLREVVLPLEDETVVLPGHGPATTIGRERATNPYLAEAAAGSGPAPTGRGL